MEITLGAALVAGILSFLSPCVLPVVPAYLGQLGVVVATTPPGTASPALASIGPSGATLMPAPVGVQRGWGSSGGWRSLPNAIAFVVGFGTIFTLLGLFVYVAVGPVKDNLPLMRTVGGILLILLGLNLMGVLRPASLMRTWRPLDRFRGGGAFGASRPQRKGVAGGLVLGAVFAVGWSPCIGPTLGAILTMAALGPGPEVALLLIAYSLGLGVPFILLALAVDRAPAITRPLVRHGHTIEVIGGGLVVAMGVAVLFDLLTVFSQAFSAFIPQV